MARLSFREFYQVAPPGRRTAMTAVGVLAVFLSITSLVTIGRILKQANQSGREVASLRRPAMGQQDMAPYTFRFELPNFSLSLPAAGGRTSYAQFSLVLDCPTLEARRHLELNRARLRDTVISASLPFGATELKAPPGILAYKSKLLAELKATFGPNAPRDLSLENFLVH